MRFKKIYIEITNTCNLSCSFCIQNQRKPRQMSVDEFSNILAQIKPYTSHIYLHVLGEPLSHPYLKEMLKLCETMDIQVNMTTNGTLLEKKEEVLLSSRLRQINVSLHSFSAHHQQDYLKQVVSVCNKLAERKTYVSYRLWCMRNGDIDEETKVILAELEMLYGMKITQVEKGTIRLKDYTFLHFEEVFTWPDLSNAMVGEQGTCLGMKQMCAILSDGTVVPCCLDSKGSINLGNIFETPFQDIIEGERAQKILNGFQKHRVVEELCQKCSYRQRFTRS